MALSQDSATIFKNNVIGALATVNDDGSPWVSPLHLFSDGQAVYWFSVETAQHSGNIKRNPRVSASLFSTDTSDGTTGVYVSGPAQTLDATEADEAKKLVLARLGGLPSVFQTATAYRLPIGRLDESKSRGNCWYFYS